MIEAVIFDLDGVLVSTDDFHYEAWSEMAQEEGIPFDQKNYQRLRGVSRMNCVDIILEKSTRMYTDKEKQELAERKNRYYLKKIERLSDNHLMPGAKETVQRLKANGLKVALGSSSKNAKTILKRLKMDALFDAIADGNDITHSKPNPEVFLLAANRMGVAPENCLVVEDADSGVEAAIKGKMKVLGIGAARTNPRATITARDLSQIDLIQFIANQR